jgi:hypothetical protein
MTHDQTYRRILNRMGYYNYQNGLIYRFMRQGENWNKHLEHCRNFISGALELIKPERVTVLGSGWLMELPMDEMIERNMEICLIDIIHPPDVIKQTKGIKNIELVELDITGGVIKEVWDITRRSGLFRKISSISNIAVPQLNIARDPGLLISLNILTQMETLPVELLKKRSRSTGEEQRIFRTGIQRNHINLLKKHQSLIISDYAEVFTDNRGKQTVVDTLLADLPEGSTNEEWIWDYDLTGSDYYNRRSIMKVVAKIL